MHTPSEIAKALRDLEATALDGAFSETIAMAGDRVFDWTEHFQNVIDFLQRMLMTIPRTEQTHSLLVFG